MKKQSAVLVAALAASLGAYAAVPTGAAPFQIVIPNLKSGLEFTLEGLWLQPTESDLDYATLLTLPTDATTSAVSTANPSYNFGFRVGLGYVFPNSGNDVQLNWTHFNNSDTDNTSFVGNDTTDQTVVTRFDGDTFDIFSGDTVNASSDVDITYDAVDLDVGQYMSIGTRLTTRLFAGLRYAQVKSNITDTYSGSFDEEGVNGGNFSEVDVYNSKFNGIGPRFGVDASYNVYDCFGVVGHFAAALLVGRVESSSSQGYNSGFVGSAASTFSESVSSDNVTRVVPALDAKLGIDYSWPINNDTSRFTIEAGWQVTQYIDAVDHLDVNSSGGVTRNTNSIGFDGPYLTLNFKM